MQWRREIPCKATVKAFGVDLYEDINFTVPVTEIDWGLVEPGQTKNFSAYIVSKSNVPVTLTMTTENWNPTNASDFITLTWSHEAAEIAVDGYVFATFLLIVDEAISGITTFTFTIIIIGSG